MWDFILLFPDHCLSFYFIAYKCLGFLYFLIVFFSLYGTRQDISVVFAPTLMASRMRISFMFLAQHFEEKIYKNGLLERGIII